MGVGEHFLSFRVSLKCPHRGGGKRVGDASPGSTAYMWSSARNNILFLYVVRIGGDDITRPQGALHTCDQAQGKAFYSCML